MIYKSFVKIQSGSNPEYVSTDVIRLNNNSISVVSGSGNQNINLKLATNLFDNKSFQKVVDTEFSDFQFVTLQQQTDINALNAQIALLLSQYQNAYSQSLEQQKVIDFYISLKDNEKWRTINTFKLIHSGYGYWHWPSTIGDWGAIAWTVSNILVEIPQPPQVDSDDAEQVCYDAQLQSQNINIQTFNPIDLTYAEASALTGGYYARYSEEQYTVLQERAAQGLANGIALGPLQQQLVALQQQQTVAQLAYDNSFYNNALITALQTYRAELGSINSSLMVPPHQGNYTDSKGNVWNWGNHDDLLDMMLSVSWQITALQNNPNQTGDQQLLNQLNAINQQIQNLQNIIANDTNYNQTLWYRARLPKEPTDEQDLMINYIIEWRMAYKKHHRHVLAWLKGMDLEPKGSTIMTFSSEIREYISSNLYRDVLDVSVNSYVKYDLVSLAENWYTMETIQTITDTGIAGYNPTINMQQFIQNKYGPSLQSLSPYATIARVKAWYKGMDILISDTSPLFISEINNFLISRYATDDTYITEASFIK